jgi:hypothetical protein
MQLVKDTLELFAPGWVGSLIGLIGIAFAGFTYVLTRHRTRLAYRYVGKRLLGLSSDGISADITVQYQGKSIERLSRSLIVFWNSGEKTILDDDIVATDPLRLIFSEDGFVLSATILKKSRDVTQCNVEIDNAHPNQVKIKFLFLDSGDGAVIEVLHTSQKTRPKIQGTVRGLPHGIQYAGYIAVKNSIANSFAKTFRLFNSTRRIAWIAIVIGILITLAGLFVPWDTIKKCSSSTQPISAAIAGAGGFYMLLGSILLFITRRKYPRSLHLEELSQ